jgi:hypothetical protein
MLATILGGRAATGLGRRVDFVEGEFEAACDVCGVRPTAIVVQVGDADFEALQKAGESGPVERHAFCAEHQGAAEALYRELTQA